MTAPRCAIVNAIDRTAKLSAQPLGARIFGDSARLR